MRSIFTIYLACITTFLLAQPTVKVEVSADTINPGDLVEVTYTIQNGEGQFVAPDFKNVPVVSGPNTSSSFMIANGQKTSSQSYSYILKAKDEGKIIIPEAYFRHRGNSLKIDKVEIIVKSHFKPSAIPSPPEKLTPPAREKRKF
ncbi:MAG: BatD family protein [Saprospiraceae bacterium]